MYLSFNRSSKRSETNIAFSDFFAVIVSFLRSVPIIGPILSHPVVAPVSFNAFHSFFMLITNKISQVVDKIAGVRVLPV